jgi:CxxC motif-containing protein (DUF1111 family)
MKAPCSQSGRLFSGLVVVLVVCFALTPNLSAQGIDPGPRPPGTTPFANICAIVGTLGNDKFNGAPNPVCFDIAQPPSNSPPQPPAGGAGNIIGGAGAGSLSTMWFQALTVFSAAAIVSTTSSPPPTIVGLGPSFNGLSCFACHAEPTVGGASPGIVTVNGNTVASNFSPGMQYNGVGDNPEFIAEGADGATNTPPCFIVPSGSGGCAGISLGDFLAPLNFDNGPVVEVRFPAGFVPSAASPDVDPVDPGAVADLFTFMGRGDAPAGCVIGQEPITQELEAGNAIFRTPTPTFGLGLVENTPELELEQNAQLNAAAKTSLGISNGVFNHVGNDQTITRFGWKAQNKSLMMFAGEASNVEMGVTNELFPNERTTGNGANCTPNPQPEDQVLGTTPTTDASQISSVMQNNAVFMRLNAAPSQCDFASGTTGGGGTGTPKCNQLSNAALQGQCFFGTSASASATAFCANATGGLPGYGIGCVLCHSSTLTTANSNTPGLGNQTFAPYSDFALHVMGSDGDGVSQGQAGPAQFRTAPLWGAGQRFFFMHDGRFYNLDDAVEGHCPRGDSTATPNESCDVISAYKNNLSTAQKTLILEFLRSL